MLHRGIARPSEVFAVQNYRTGVAVASNKAARYRTLANLPRHTMTLCSSLLRPDPLFSPLVGEEKSRQDEKSISRPEGGEP